MDDKQYNVINGTSYHPSTPEKLIHVLEQCRQNNTRIIVDYGDIRTGESWDEVYDVSGYVGRSTGTNKIPLLVHNSRSLGGSGLLDHCILTVKTSKGKKLLYSYK